jgi:hypothetical protein
LGRVTSGPGAGDALLPLSEGVRGRGKWRLERFASRFWRERHAKDAAVLLGVIKDDFGVDGDHPREVALREYLVCLRVEKTPLSVVLEGP